MLCKEDKAEKAWVVQNLNGVLFFHFELDNEIISRCLSLISTISSEW